MAELNGAEERVDDGFMSLDFNRICRLCLNFCRDYVDLRPPNGTGNAPHHIIDQIRYCYGIRIDLTQPLPSKVCLQCIQILTLLSATKRNIKYSEMMLKNILNIRNAHYVINAQSRQVLNHTILQGNSHSNDDHQREQEPSVMQDRPTQDNSPMQNLRISPIQVATVQELYRIQERTIQNSNNQNVPTNPNQSQGTKEHTERKNIENPQRNTENAGVVENKTIEIKQDNSNDTNAFESFNSSNTVESSTNSNAVECSSSGPSCGTSTDKKPTDIKPPEKIDCKTTKTVEEDKNKSANKTTNVVNNINKKRPIEIDLKRDLRVKLEVLDLKSTKLFCPPSTNGSSGSTEGKSGRTSGESKSGKVVKEIGTVIDENNILSPQVKRTRKSIPKG